MYAASDAHTGLKHSNVVPRLHEFKGSRKSSDASTDYDDLLGCASRKCKFHILRRQSEGAIRGNGKVDESSATQHLWRSIHSH
jgi:hypothetical protein